MKGTWLALRNICSAGWQQAPQAEHTVTGGEARLPTDRPPEALPGLRLGHSEPIFMLENPPTLRVPSPALQESIDQLEDIQVPGLIGKVIKPGQQVQQNRGSYTELEEDHLAL